jgi:hypothetical protein
LNRSGAVDAGGGGTHAGAACEQAVCSSDYHPRLQSGSLWSTRIKSSTAKPS